MTLTPQQEKLFVDPAPVPPTVFVNDRVSFQTEDNQRVILVHGIVFSHYSWTIVPPKPTHWFCFSNPDTPIRTIWRAASATPLELYDDFRSALSQED